MKPAALNPITEDDIAQFLVHTPDFFDRHAELLATVRLGSPHGGRAVSLQERQAEMLREKIRALEARMMEMIRHGNDNAVLTQRLQRWSQALFLVPQASDLPRVLAEQIEHQFMVPQVALRLWGVAQAHQGQPQQGSHPVGIGELLPWPSRPSSQAGSHHGGRRISGRGRQARTRQGRGE